nr:TLC domain-containing protein [Oceanusvirus sp.]
MLVTACIAAGFLGGRFLVRRRFRLSERDSHKAVTTVHNVIAVPLALRSLSKIPSRTLDVTCPSSRAMCKFSSGYFLYDIISARRNPVMLLHALGSGTLYTYTMMTGNFHSGAAGHILWEISSPFVHAREIMADRGMKDTRIYKLNGIAMIVVFFACRNVWGLMLTADGLSRFRAVDPARAMRKPVRTAFVGLSVVMNSLNAYWMSKMIRGAIKVFWKGTS